MDFLKSVLIEPFIDGDIVSLLIGIVMWILLIVIVGFLIFGIYYLFDYAGLKSKEGEGLVVEKIFIKSHTTTSFIYVNKTMIPQIQYHPDNWLLEIKIGSKSSSFSVSKKIWDRTNVDDVINCLYSCGRLSGDLYIKGLLIAEE